MPDHMGSETFELVLVAQRDTVPPIVRLRLVFKGLLRAHNFRGLSCVDVTPKLPPTASSVATGGGKTAGRRGPSWVT
jgi:hypothetical protein